MTTFTSVDLWERHRVRCLALLREALAALDPGPAGESEAELNDRLYKALLTAHHAAELAGFPHLSVVVAEGQNPTVGGDLVGAPRGRKIPDFYWAYIDHLSAEPTDCARQFVVECKRIAPPTPDWEFTARYVHSGIRRFIDEEHGYGKMTAAGAMVGYLQSMPDDEAEEKVAEVLAGAGLPALSRTPAMTGLVELTQTLVRTVPESPFQLTHHWVETAA